MARPIRRALPALLALIAAPASAADRLALPDDAARVRADALIAEIDRQLRASDSATLTLERWCAAHDMARPARILVQLQAAAKRPPSAAQRDLLGVAAGNSVRYRKVRLACGSHILSEAENWYVPGRLTAAMNAALDGSDEPFGKVIRPLAPTRRTLADRRVWRATKSPSTPCGSTVFSHEALVLDGTDRPLALVAEHYKLELLCGIGTGDAPGAKIDH